MLCPQTLNHPDLGPYVSSLGWVPLHIDVVAASYSLDKTLLNLQGENGLYLEAGTYHTNIGTIDYREGCGHLIPHGKRKTA